MGTRIEALSVPGGRGRAACARVAELGSDLGGALRRAIPFLARRRVVITAEPARCVPFADLASDPKIAHASAFTIRAVGSPTPAPAAAVRGVVLFDEVALARILDGVLGGDGSATTAVSAPSSAQTALATRVTGTLLRAFSEVIASRLALLVEPAAAKDIAAGTAVVLPLVMEGGGKVMLAIPLSVVTQDEESTDSDRIDSGLAAAMTDVELDVVAELGKVRLPLEAIAQLAIGDVIRLSLPLDERARICAGGATLFHGRPTASGHVVAVAIERMANER
ncbi:MAG TPA: FliM/FliN family flagellar motor switch protein [Labilithrix sp.]|nr:FliM/FliN family flagellar motor switch protein [Labilithrix sp.]